MINQYVRVRPLENHEDQRGYSFSVPEEILQFVGNVNDIHIAAINSNSVRGNHYHVSKKEFIVVAYSGSWVLAWDTGENTKVNKKQFDGQGAVAIEIEPQTSHAIKNIGETPLVIVACSSKKYNPANSDTLKRDVL